MKKLCKYLMTMAIFMVLLWQVPANAQTSEPDYTALADYLKEIGLFKGTSTGYALNEDANRVQGAVMLVRLLGKEQEALSNNAWHPFDDVPAWADAYVGYLYEHHISNGVSETAYGAELPLKATQYMTFVLRVLGYSDVEGDFEVEASLDKAAALELITEEEASYYRGNGVFKRNGMVFFSYKALQGMMSDNSGTLLHQLVAFNIVLEDAYMGYKTAPYVDIKKPSVSYTDESLKNAIIAGVIDFDKRLELDLTGYSYSKERIKVLFDDVQAELRQLPGYSSTVDSYSYSVGNDGLYINFTYRVTKDQMMAAAAEAQSVVDQVITAGMDDYTKELLLHDYIVEKTTYKEDKADEAIYTMVGVLINGKAVCQGYADAFFYLGTMAGLQCDMVFGDADSNGTKIPHAWNVVYIDGKPYQLDATWDDPQSQNGGNLARYDYFNLTNEEMAQDHFWDISVYAYDCDDTQANYFVMNDLMLDMGQVAEYIESQLSRSEAQIMFRVTSDITESKINAILSDNSRHMESVSYSVNTDLDTVLIMDIDYQ